MRHGETDWNKKKLVQGRKDIPLNEYGRHLALETSYGMRQYQIDLAYTSPLRRAKETAEIVGLSAIKYGDLSNQATKDYVFDIDRFTSFEGNTGPYILYTIVRIKSILNRYKEGGNLEAGEILPAVNASQKNLMLELTKFGSTIENAFEEKAPHKICAYIYEVSNAFNSFYHETKILSEENQAQKESFLKLLGLTKDILETSIDLLGFSAPDRM